MVDYRPPIPLAALVSFRLGGADGVSVEAGKWTWALQHLGFDVQTVAGEGAADIVVPRLAIGADEPPSCDEVARAVAGADVVVVENLCSLPLNPAAAEVVAEVLAGRRAVLHHHDLPWQRDRFAHFGPPPDDPAWLHVTINDLSRRQLAEHGIEAATVRNAFDPDPPRGDRHGTRTAARLGRDDLLAVQPTRAIARKGVQAALHAAERLDAAYWLVGPAEEGYGDELHLLLERARVRVLRGLPEDRIIADCYAAADVVLFPSSWEGFGNPVVESALHGKPLVLRRYPVAVELEEFGFEWFDIDDVEAARRWLAAPDPRLVERNRTVARRHFNLHDLPARLGGLFEQAGWTW
jgi:glycosyltransferase involved in cell wall biosynthesis